MAAQLAEAGETSGERIGGAAFRRLMIAGETPALAVHVVLASIAVAGIGSAGLSLRRLRSGDEACRVKIARWGGAVGTGAVAAAIAGGLVDC